MKHLYVVSFAAVSLTACSNIDFSKPFRSDTDPLSSPLVEKSKRQSRSSSSSEQLFSVGSWVETAMPDAPFYTKYPRFSRKASYNLPVSTPVKVLGYKGKYVKVERGGGESGYIEGAMLIEQSRSSTKTRSKKYNKTSSSNYKKNNRSYSSNSNNKNYKKKSYSNLSSDPAPPTEDEILKKIRAREARARSQKAPVINVPSAPQIDDEGLNSFSPPEPEIKGITEFSNSGTTISPPSVPKIPSKSIQNDRANIRINRPFGSDIPQPLGSNIDQDAALELRITERLDTTL